jgi:GNAT superfamily N-acetyltransferase
MPTPTNARFLSHASGPQGTTQSNAAGFRVRETVENDVAAAAAGVGALLEELGGEVPAAAELEAATRVLVERPEVGTLLVAEAGGEVVGVLAASWVHAVHVPGHYGVIQDLWVRPDFRGRAVGRELVEGYVEIARAHGAVRLEVGLPKESFERIEATERFYLGNEFASLGIRMRRKLR